MDIEDGRICGRDNMIGRHHLEIENRKVRYILDIERKVVVIKGNSGTGKTTLIRMLQVYIAQGNKSGVLVKNFTSIPLMVLDNTTRWELELAEQTSKIIFVDEAVDYIYSKDFQEEFTKSPHYLVVISRSGKFNHLPYAIKSIYQFKTEHSNKIKLTKMYQIYENDVKQFGSSLIITEDSNSGADMMREIFKTTVKTANGNSNVVKILKENIEEEGKIIAVVDGAAFGGFIAPLMNVAKLNDNVQIYAPESFEYMLLQTDSLKRKLEDELENTWKYCDISKYLTWEQYYTDLIGKICEQEYNFSYSKAHLHKSFMNESTKNQVKQCLFENGVKEM